MKRTKANQEAKQESDRLAAINLNPLILNWEGTWPQRRAKAIATHGTHHHSHILTFSTPPEVRLVRASFSESSK